MGQKHNLKKQHKAFKARHATKGSIKAANKGRIEQSEGIAKKHVMTKLERRNLKTQARATKMSALAEKNKIFDGRNGVPRNVAIIPLTGDIDSVKVAEQLSTSLEAVQSNEGAGILSIPKFRQKLRLFIPKFQDFYQIMDAARGADFVLFVLSATEEIKDYGEQIIRCITSQGVSTSFGTIWNLQESLGTQLKEKQVVSSLTSWFTHFFPSEKLYNLENDSENKIIGRLLCQRTPKGIHWRDSKAYIIPEQMEVDSNNNIVLIGSVRGKSLSPSQFMFIQGYGDYKIAKIELLHGGNGNAGTSENAGMDVDMETDMEDDQKAIVSTEFSRLLPAEEAIEIHEDVNEHMEGRGIRVDGHADVTSLVEAKAEDNMIKQSRKLPEGTSSYQAAWFIEGEDYESDEDANILTDEEGELVAAEDNEMEDDNNMESESESGDEEMELESHREHDIEREAKDDLEFPDEIELDPMVPASKRLARYRGVRSIRHTDWDAREYDQRMPEEYPRLFRPGNLIAKGNYIVKNLGFSDVVSLGSKIKIYLETNDTNVRTATEEPSLLLNNGQLIAAYSLLPGEEKLGFVNTTITMDSEVMEPIKSKQPILIQYGPRRMLINPLYSQGGNSDNDVYKFFRFIHPGRTAVVTFIGPVSLTNAPVVYYRHDPENTIERKIIGAGSVQDSDADRIIVKTAILTGLPVKIHRKLITIKHMFFSRKDVEYFMQVPLFTKLGAQGFIKECLGTHGLFKATFDKKIKSEDTIAMALYKRVWPKRAVQV